ncbi:MAG: DUF1080 domain-containing protein [Verrucomicrobia bacterium]|jgi:type 1 glutamine amidotransferase|nr:DUF1080 domain-containing protein [Verrucomicrobiota bacterium]
MPLLKPTLLSSFLLSALSLPAKSDWQPTYNDKPVPQERALEVAKALPKKAIVPVTESRRVLICSATAGFRHASIPTGKLALIQMGESTGAYEAVVSDDPDNFELDALRTFDAIILLSPTQDFFMPNAKQRRNFSDEEWAWLRDRHNRLIDNLVQYVEAGGGLMGIHSATDACYGHPDYPEMIGGLFDGHPWRANANVTIVVEDPTHATIEPVFGDMEDFRIKEEIYQFRPEPYSREKLRILLHLDPERSDPGKRMKREDNDYPVAWVQSVGQGRVFYSSLGHRHDIYTNPLMLKHFLAGIQFASGDLEADTTPSARIGIPNVVQSAGPWISLFDGETLNGWTQRDGKATYEVRDGVIVGRSKMGTPNSFLCTEATYGDFVLEFEVKCGTINSGVQIRSQASRGDKQRVNGPQVEIEHSPGQAGYIYGEAYENPGWRSPEPQSKDPEVSAHSIFKNDGWNHYKVLAKGAHIQTWINGQAVADLVDAESFELYPEGFIGLQVHSHFASGVEIEWRNIRIREIN